MNHNGEVFSCCRDSATAAAATEAKVDEINGVNKILKLL